MKLNPNQIEALKRYREQGQLSPYSQKYMNDLDSMDKMTSAQSQFTPFSSPMESVDLTPPSLNMGVNRPQYPERFSLNVPQTFESEEAVAENPDQKFDGADAYSKWYANKVSSEPIKFASIRDKLEKGW
jgi:hypothetical protein